MKRSCVLLSSIISIVFGGLVIVGATSALEYQTSLSTGDNPVTLKFEFGSTLNITTGGNISISDLTPGTKAISASNYNVTVSTNNLTGYTLSATVGCSSGTDCYDSKNLSDGTNTFSMLSTDGALTAGTWGVSLDSSATANSNFKTLAKYDETATIINKTTNNTGTPATGYAGTANTTVRVGAYATNSQVAGTYTNSINFIAVANYVETRTIADIEYMQEITPAIISNTAIDATTTLKDSRDNVEYTVSKLIDGKVWMLDNLAIDLTTVSLDALKNGTNATDTSLEYLKGVQTRDPSVDPSGKYATAGVANWTTSQSYSAPLINMASKDVVPSGAIEGSKGQNKVGGYYNYCAASAGSFCYDFNDSSSSLVMLTEDICPSGWHIPTEIRVASNSTWSEFRILTNEIIGTDSYNYYNDDALLINKSLSVPLSGSMSNGYVYDLNSRGYIWGGKGSTNEWIQNLFDRDEYDIQDKYVSISSASSRRTGASIRCLAD